VPYLIDGTRAVWDSLGIVEYLAERHGGVWPADEDARAWARCATAEMHSGFAALRNVCSMSVGVEVRLFEIGPDLVHDIARIETLWEEGLARFGGPFLAGQEFTAVDSFYAPVVFRFLTYGIELGPEAARYVERMRVLPAMAEWYDAALRETWRDAPHEIEIAAAGRIVRDLRA
jgi:glutathione S-transferase